MTRSNGSFPTFTKTDLDPRSPKTGWNVGCRRCMQCGKNWPNISAFSPSPCCNTQSGIVGDGTPEMDWSSAVKQLLSLKFERLYERWNEGVSDEQLMWLTPPDKSLVSELEISEGLDEIDRIINSLEGAEIGYVE